MPEPTTIKGYTADKILELMQWALPQGATKKHESKSYLTSISPAFTMERLTNIFGMYGYGWGVDWSPENMESFETTTSGGKPRYHCVIKQAVFWFRFGEDSTVKFPVTGHSDNDNPGDAMAGARTRCISDAAKHLLFQLHIYKNTTYQTPTPVKSDAFDPEPKKPAQSQKPKPKPVEGSPKPKPKPAETNGRPYDPATLKESLLKSANSKSDDLKKMEARDATSSVTAALIQRAYAEPPQNGQSIEERKENLISANDKYHEFLFFIFGDRAKGENGEISNKNLSQADLLTLLNWISGGKAAFNANLLPEAVEEAWLVWENIKS